MSAVFRPVGLLAVVLVAAACTSGGPAGVGSGPRIPASATPAGSVPVDYGDAQISVPAAWRVTYDDSCLSGGPPGSLFVGISPPDSACGEEDVGVPRLQILPIAAVSGASGRSTALAINGIATERTSSGSTTTYSVPALGIALVANAAAEPEVLTLARSPAAVALAAGPFPDVPQSWQWVDAGDLRFAVPAGWARNAETEEGPICVPWYTIPWPSEVTLDSDSTRVEAMCPLTFPTRRVPQPHDGVVVDLHPNPSLAWPPASKLDSCLSIHGVTECPYDRTPAASNDLMAQLDILFVQVTVGHTREMLEIGLAGDGTVARTILGSVRPA